MRFEGGRWPGKEGLGKDSGESDLSSQQARQKHRTDWADWIGTFVEREGIPV